MMKMKKYLTRGHEAFLFSIEDLDAKNNEPQIIPVVDEFADVFPNEIPGVPPPRMDGSMKPPELDGHNYSFWKARMEIYLQAQGTRVYCTVLTEWSPPTVQNADGTAGAKLIETWTEEEMTSSDLNNKALNSIVGSLHESVFTLVTGIKEAKRVWDTLETRYEGTSDVKQSKLQLALSEFESLSMGEEETISTFHSRVQNLMNRAPVLGEPFTDERVVTAIQEHSGWEKKSVGELMGSLHTYELELLADDEPIITEKASTEGVKDNPTGHNTKVETPHIRKQKRLPSHRTVSLKVAEQDKSEVIRLTQKKAMSVATLSDDEDEAANDQADENVGNFVAFFISSEENDTDEESYIPSDDFEERHTQLELEFAKLVGSWEQLVKVNKSLNDDLKQRDDHLKKLSTELVLKEDLITQIRSQEGKLIKELEDLKKKIKMMDTTSTLDKILDSGRNPNDKKGLGFERGESSKMAPMFIKEGTSVDRSFHNYDQSQSSQIKQKGIIHTRIADPQSGRFKIHSQYSRKEKYQNKSITPFVRQVWVRKSEVICYPTIVLTASMTATRWYFDSGCSRHMIGNVKCLMSIQPSSGSVTYGDGQKGKIVGKDQVVMEGTRSSDNCYVLTNETACLISKTDESKLWHRRLGHINFRDMDKMIKLDAVRGIPKLKIEHEGVCGACAIGKQIRAPHKAVKVITTERCPELFSWVYFLREKSEAFNAFKTLCIRVQKEKD
ncbi:PREDICTED: uncharacterized protein LOC109168107 [Ipomoea nil]|uniref:uncharacterized protein LOC109168107 n=1 Tax=Ipomoea nil TaxID=35883 RepID=UPI00090102B5|nr:PREDICTED: uncharacterized protein LOC109168107 [Ipomoea nil]